MYVLLEQHILLNLVEFIEILYICLFNIGILHATGPAKEKNIRIIYNFNHDCVLDDYKDQVGCLEKWKEGCITYG